MTQIPIGVELDKNVSNEATDNPFSTFQTNHEVDMETSSMTAVQDSTSEQSFGFDDVSVTDSLRIGSPASFARLGREVGSWSDGQPEYNDDTQPGIHLMVPENDEEAQSICRGHDCALTKMRLADLAESELSTYTPLDRLGVHRRHHLDIIIVGAKAVEAAQEPFVHLSPNILALTGAPLSEPRTWKQETTAVDIEKQDLAHGSGDVRRHSTRRVLKHAFFAMVFSLCSVAFYRLWNS